MTREEINCKSSFYVRIRGQLPIPEHVGLSVAKIWKSFKGELFCKRKVDILEIRAKWRDCAQSL